LDKRFVSRNAAHIAQPVPADQVRPKVGFHWLAAVLPRTRAPWRDWLGRALDLGGGSLALGFSTARRDFGGLTGLSPRGTMSSSSHLVRINLPCRVMRNRYSWPR
jgi:hypothetical protein